MKKIVKVSKTNQQFNVICDDFYIDENGALVFSCDRDLTGFTIQATPLKIIRMFAPGQWCEAELVDDE